MASSIRANALPQFILTPQQQNLLFRALTSNQPATNDKSPEDNTLSPQSLTTSPTQNQSNSGLDLTEGPQESPFVDYDYDFGPDGSFDFDFNADGNAKMIGDLPGSGGSQSSKDDSKSSSPENESSDKRGHPDEDDDDDIDEGGGKRRESEKVPKKPGRKPLTNEPSSKRKAQNRAAQRAFRERKERHLKDLETKVEELEKVSDATNNENSQLKSQIEKLTMELNEYKKRVTLLSNAPRSASSGSRNQPFGFGAIQNLSDVNFQFEFPKFGSLPAPQNGVNGNAKRSETYPSPSNTNSNKNSPQEKPREKTNSGSAKDGEASDSQRKDASVQPPTNNNNVSPYENTYSGTASRTSLDSTTFSVNGAAGASPSSSSNSNMGPSSSCGTSPEPFTQSPVGFKPVDTLTTIGEEHPSITSDQVNAGFGSTFGNIDFGNLDWLSHQNGGQFDPQLFGDYREPQNNVLTNATLDDSFFNDAFDIDFTTPYNVAPSSSSPKPAKKNICDEIDAQKEQDDTPVTAVNSKLLTCNNIWEKLQTCPKVHNGEIDLDGLCSDLQKKAKCGGTGAVVDEHDFKAIMTRYLGTDANCPDSS
ncbi:DNA-binding transcription factor yap1 [Diatrype stigma]|uniref:DNA-binding transcription factor yap1 n=1 Tax=Diatrype stigma TaxID=117547 RepID=A0AAN9UVC7_9PEZI